MSRRPGRPPGGEPKLSPRQQELVLEELDRGRTYEQVQADLREAGIDVALSTLKAYRAKARAAARKAAPTAAAEAESAATERLRERQAGRRSDEPAEEAPDLSKMSLVELTRHQYLQALKASATAQVTGDWSVAARHSKNAADLANTIARLEKAANENKDSVVLTPQELADAEHQLRDRVRAALERPLLCAHCSRQVSLDFGGVREAVDAGDAAP